MQPSELDDWAEDAAGALGVDFDPADVATILDLARDVAHAVARPAAPLTSFLAGVAVGQGHPLPEVVAVLAAALERRQAG